MGINIYFLTIAEWWKWGLSSIPVFLGLYAAVRTWHNAALSKCREENKMLRGENTKLTREALIRIDDLQDCYKQIDELQVKVLEQRERSQRLIGKIDES